MAEPRYVERLNWDGYLVLKKARQTGSNIIEVEISGDEEWQALLDYLRQRPWKVFEKLENARLRDELIYWHMHKRSESSAIIHGYTTNLDVEIQITRYNSEAEIIVTVTRPTITVTHRNTCT